MTEYQVVIVGGGATGVGILRDLSMRGISALLLEQGNYMELRKLGGVIVEEG